MAALTHLESAMLVYYVTYYTYNGKPRRYSSTAPGGFHDHIRKVYPKSYSAIIYPNRIERA